MDTPDEKNEASTILYQVLSTAFCLIVVISNIISVKMVPLPFFEKLFIPVGLITYPLTFMLSDLVSEIFGAKLAKRMVYITLGMNILTYSILQLALHLPGQTIEGHTSFHSVLGHVRLRVFSSLAAYVVAQWVDIQIYAMLKQWTGLRFLWIRANGSTWISQIIDTVLIDTIFLRWGMSMLWTDVMPIMIFSIAYKIFFSLATTPVFYLLVFVIRRNFNKLKTFS